MRIALSLLAAATALACGAGAADAAVLHVNATGDGLGDCVTPGGSCTLREAMLEAKVGSPGEPDTIHLGPGVHVNEAQDFIVSIGEQVTIIGAGARQTSVREQSGGDGRVFLVEQDASLTLTDLTVTGARDNSGVLLFGTGNAVRATRVTFAGNSALARGGAIDGTGGAVELTDSTLAGNTAAGFGGMPGEGGAIFSGGTGGSLKLTNVTVSGNTAESGNGIHVAAGPAELRSVTLADGLFTDPAAPAVSVAGSILGSCAGLPPASAGFNLEPATTCALGAPGDRPGQDPLLAPLADNGGPTDTRAPAAESPAIDAVTPCLGDADQRGVARPRGPACDIGAFEAPATQMVPRITRLSIAPKVLRTGRRAKRRSARVRYRLNVAAKVRFRVERRTKGRRWVRVRGSFTRTGNRGANSLRFRARIGGRVLVPARYRLVATPRGGRASRTGFRVARG
jgi:predicted outer membrane repeat protein